jgi:hypothetical protein
VAFSITLFVLNASNSEKSSKLLVALFCFLKEREKPVMTRSELYATERSGHFEMLYS